MEVVVPDEFKYLYVQNDERPVVKVPNAVLRAKAADVLKVGRKEQLLIDEMMRVMKRSNGVGLAAPQLGIGRRIIVFAPDGSRPAALINPRVIRAEGELKREEGCLSIPGLYGDVSRPAYVEVEGLDRRGRQVSLELEDMPARVVQHEIDHLDGVLFIDKVDVSTLHWSHPDRVEHDENE